ncbi:MAG: hypothetical protein WEB04_11950 [Dehalococcoidia bacterium]
MFHKARRIQGGLIALVAGAAAVAVLLAGLAFGATGAQAQTAGESYGGPIEVLVAGTCGGGSITLTVGDDGASITEVSLDGLYVGPVLVNALATPPGGAFVVALDPPIEIADDGSFEQTVQPVPGVDADFAGQFDGDTVTGTLGVAALDCVDVPFSGEAGVVPPTSTPGPTPTATAAAVLPKTGSGSAGSSDSTTLLVMLAAAAGVATLATGYALRRRA